MATVSESEAVKLAEAFLAQRQGKPKHGQLLQVSHKPLTSGPNNSGTFHVAFAYAGPPVRKDAVPPRDHPTVVLVDDITGECKVMLWL
jgi:hypothetical protein